MFSLAMKRTMREVPALTAWRLAHTQCLSVPIIKDWRLGQLLFSVPQRKEMDVTPVFGVRRRSSATKKKPQQSNRSFRTIKSDTWCWAALRSLGSSANGDNESCERVGRINSRRRNFTPTVTAAWYWFFDNFGVSPVRMSEYLRCISLRTICDNNRM
jgi:hypothetical protein